MSKKWSPEPLFDPVDSLVLGIERLGKTKKKKQLTFSERLKKYKKTRLYKDSFKTTSIGRLDDKHLELDELNEIIRRKKKYNRSRKKKKNKSKGKTRTQRGGRSKRRMKKKTKRRR